MYFYVTSYQITTRVELEVADTKLPSYIHLFPTNFTKNFAYTHVYWRGVQHVVAISYSHPQKLLTDKSITPVL